MPVYQYQVLENEKGCPDCRKGFEVEQRMSDDRLETCPRCGAKVRRIISAPNIATHWRQSILSDANLRRHGFKKLNNEGDGRFHVS